MVELFMLHSSEENFQYDFDFLLYKRNGIKWNSWEIISDN